MIRRRNQIKKLRFAKTQYSCMLFFLYLCIPFLRFVFSKLFGFIGFSGLSQHFVIIVISLLLFFLYAYCRRILILDFWLIYFSVAIFFLVSYLLHPDNKYWFVREEYGALTYVFRLDNGIFIYLFIRLINDPKRIIKTIKFAGWPMYLYYTRQIIQAVSRGYWIDTSNRGYEIHISYNLSLGYNVLLFVLAFLYCALEEKKIMDWVSAAFGLFIILTGGSRGPFLDIFIFLAIYFLIRLEKSKKKSLIVASTIIGSGILLMSYSYIVRSLISILDSLNISSRFLTKLIEGEIMESDSRIKIWRAAWNMIREKPLGYGAFGSRPVISEYIYVAHPHQVFLEILIDFGVIAGSIFILWLLISAIRIFRKKNIGEWKGVFLIVFARACQLLVSLTFWHSIGLWAAIAVGVCIHSNKEKTTYDR